MQSIELLVHHASREIWSFKFNTWIGLLYFFFYEINAVTESGTCEKINLSRNKTDTLAHEMLHYYIVTYTICEIEKTMLLTLAECDSDLRVMNH